MNLKELKNTHAAPKPSLNNSREKILYKNTMFFIYVYIKYFWSFKIKRLITAKSNHKNYCQIALFS